MENEADKVNKPNLDIREELMLAEELQEKRNAIRNTIIRFVIVFLLMGFFALSIALNRDYDGTMKEKYRHLNDAFTVPSVVGFMCWMITIVSSEGAFDALGYIGGIVGRALIPFGRNRRHRETYAEYKERKEEDRKPHQSVGWSISRCTILSSIIYFAVSLVFLCLWYNA